jgi:hypothetical protein
MTERSVRSGASCSCTQPAFGWYRPDAQTAIANAHALFVLTLEGDRVSAITWFGDKSVFPNFGLPRTLRQRRALS